MPVHVDLARQKTSNKTTSSHSDEAEALSDDVEEGDLNELAVGMASGDFTLDAGDSPLSEEDIWYDALEQQEGTPPPNVAGQLLTHLVTRAMLLTSKHLLERATGVTATWQQVSEIYTDQQLTAFAKAERLAQLLHQQQHVIPSEWHEVIGQVLEGFELIRALQRISLGDETTMVARVEQGIVQLQGLLAQPLVKRTLPESVQQTLRASLPPIRQTIASLQAFAALPEGASFEDYLAVVKQVLTDPRMGGDLAPQVLSESITRVEQLFSQVKAVLTTVTTGVDEVSELQASFPGLDASFELKMAWLSQALATPSVLAVFRQQLSPDTLTLLQQILPWFRQLNSYPADSALGQQAAWLMQQFSDPAALALIQQPPLQPIIEQIKQQLGGDSTSLALFQALLHLTAPNQSVGQKLRQLVAPLVTQQSLTLTIRGAISYGSGYGPVLDVWDWYWQLPSGLSWEQTLHLFIEKLQAHPERLIQLLPHPLPDAIKGVNWLRQYPKGGSWQETLQWAAKSAQQVPQLQWLYDRFVELSLAKAVYDALRQPKRAVQEEALRQVARDLAQYWPGLAETGGGVLTTMIPLLPSLLNISQDIYRLPSADSWLDWGNSVLSIIQGMDSPALQQLGQQLENMIANRFVEGLSAGLDKASEAASATATAVGCTLSTTGAGIAGGVREAWGAVTSLDDPLRFPGAEAVPIVVLPGHILQHVSQADETQAWTLFDSATESNKQDLLTTPEIKSWFDRRTASAEVTASTTPEALTTWKEISPPVERVSSDKEDTTTVLPMTELGSSTLNNVDDYFIESPVDDSPYNFDFLSEDLAPPERAAYSVAQKAGGAALAVWWLGTVYVAYKTYDKHRVHAQKRTAFAKAAAEPENREKLNPVSLGEGAADERVTVENIPLVAELADSVKLDMEPVEEPKYSYTLPAVLTAMILTGAAGTGSLIYSILPEHFDESGLLDLKSNPELKALWDKCTQYSSSTNRRRRSLLKTSEQQISDWKEIIFDLIAFEAYSDRARPVVDNMIDMAIDWDLETLDQFLYTMIAGCYTLIDKNKTRLTPENNEITSAIILLKKKLEQLFLTNGNKRSVEILTDLATMYSAACDFITAHEASFSLQEVSEREYIDAVEQYYIDNHSVAIRNKTLSEVYSQSVAAAETIFTEFIVGIFKKNQAQDANKNELADFFRRNIDRYGTLENINLNGSPSDNPYSVDKGRIAYINGIKYHLTVLFNNSKKFFDMLSLLNVNALYGRFSGDRAVFEAQILAAKITIKTFLKAGGDGTDLSDDEYLDAYMQMKRMSEEMVNYLDMAAAFIYAVFMKNVSLNIANAHRPEGYDDKGVQERYVPWRMIQNFTTAERRAYALTSRALSEPPKEFKGIAELRSSSTFSSWAEYFDQFSEYTRRFLGYESELNSYYALVRAGLDDYCMSRLVAQQVELLDLCGLKLNTSTMLGAGASKRSQFTLSYGVIGFIKMTTGEVLVVTAINGQTRAKFYTQAEVSRNTTLLFIFSGALSRFSSPYTVRKTWFGLGSETYKDYESDFNIEGIRLGAGADIHHGRSAGPLSGSTVADNVLNELFEDTKRPWGDGIPHLYVKSGLAYDPHVEPKSRDDISTRGRTLISIVDEIMRINLQEVSGVLKVRYEEETMWGLFASNFIPFYDTIRREINDIDYAVSAEEITSNLFQLLLLIAPYGFSMKNLVDAQLGVLRVAVKNALGQGLKGPIFVKAVARSIAADPQFVVFPILRKIQYIADVCASPLPYKIKLKLLSRIRKVMAEGGRVGPPAANVRAPVGPATVNAANTIFLGEGKTIPLRDVAEVTAPNLGLAEPLAVSESSLADGLVPEGTSPVAAPVATEPTLLEPEPRMEIDALCRPGARRQRKDTTPVCQPNTTAEQAEIDAMTVSITPISSNLTNESVENLFQKIHAKLRSDGYTDVHYVALGVWHESAKGAYVRYAVSATKNQVEMAADLFLRDFMASSEIMQSSTVSTKNNWLNKIIHTYKDKTHLVKSSRIQSDYLDSTVFSNITKLNAYTPVSGAEVLVAPFWYKAHFPLEIPSVASSTRLSAIENSVNIARQAREGARGINVTESWKFPIEVQQLAKLLPESEASTLSTSSAPPNREAYLGGEPLVIASQDQMRRVPKAVRIAFSEEGAEQVAHGMISTGEGRAIGIRNQWLDPLYGAATREVDLADDLVWKDDGAYLPRGDKKVNIAAQPFVSSVQPQLERYEPHTSTYKKDYAINIKGLDAIKGKIALKLGKSDTRVQVFDERIQAYSKSKNYAVVSFNSTIYEDVLLDDAAVRTAMRDFKSKYQELENIASDYTGLGADDLRANLAAGKAIVSELSHEDLEVSSSIIRFALIENPSATISADNILGFAKIVDLPPSTTSEEAGKIVIQSVVAHPYSIISKNDAFMAHAAQRLPTPAQAILSRYRLKRIGGQLVRDGVKRVLQKIDNEVATLGRTYRPAEIIMSSRNPITAQLAERFGGKIIFDGPGAVGIVDPTFVHAGSVKPPVQVVTRDSPLIIAEKFNTELTPLKELSVAEQQLVTSVESIIERDSVLAQYISKPSENCDKAASRVGSILIEEGFTNISFGELGIWRSDFGAPANHFVVFASKLVEGEIVEIAIDITAGQFRKPGMQGPIYNTPGNWVSIIKTAFGGGDRHQNLVKYKAFNQPFGINKHTGVNDLFHLTLNPFENIPGAEILARPRWHSIVFETLERRTEASARFDATISRALSTEAGATSTESSWDFVLELQQEAGILPATVAKKWLGKTWNRNNYNKYLNGASAVSDLEALSKVPKGNRMVLEVVRTGSSHPMLSLGGGYALAVDNTWLGVGYGAGVQKISLISDFEEAATPGAFKLRQARGEVKITAEPGNKLPTVGSPEPSQPETEAQRAARCRRGLLSDCMPSLGAFKEDTQLVQGDISPLKGKGPFTLEGSPDDVPFDYQVYRYDDIGAGVHMREPENIATGGAACDPFLLRGTGEGFLTPTGKQLLGENVRVINVVNGEAGTVAIKIHLSRITEANPLLVWSGELSGCTVIYAVKDDYFYAYHGGLRSNAEGLPLNWTTSVEGVNSIAKSHTALTGAELSELQLNNNSLIDIFSSYDSAVITYMGKEGRVITKTASNVKTFNYAETPYVDRTWRSGSAQVLLTRKSGKVKLECLSEDIFNPATPLKSMNDVLKDYKTISYKITPMGDH